jgi:hypothetical protein
MPAMSKIQISKFQIMDRLGATNILIEEDERGEKKNN